MTFKMLAIQLDDMMNFEFNITLHLSTNNEYACLTLGLVICSPQVNIL